MAERNNSKVLLVQFSYAMPSGFNDAQDGEKNQLVGMFAVEATTLRTPREIATLASIRLEAMLALLLEEAASVTEAYNQEHPLPVAEQAEGEEDGEAVDLQA